MHRPTKMVTIEEKSFSGIKDSSPLCYTVRFPFIREIDVLSGIPHLLCLRSPSTVARRISFIVINALNGMFTGWSTPHVIGKLLKQIPLTTDRYSATTVAFIRRVVLVTTPLPHCLPDKILWQFFATTTMSIVRIISSRTMLSAYIFSSYFFLYTTARSCMARPKTVCSGCFLSPTRAGTKPTQFIIYSWCLANYSEFSKYMADKIKFFHANILSDIAQMKGKVATALSTGFGFDALATNRSIPCQ